MKNRTIISAAGFMSNSVARLSALAFIMLFSFGSLSAQTQWTVDKAHSTVKFTVSHLVISEVEGSFKAFDGSLQSGNPDFTNAQINFTVDVASISTDNTMRDNHLKSDDFFNAEKYPQMNFKSVSFVKKSGNKYALTGDLTIRNTTRRVTFDVVYGGTAKDGYGNTKAGFKATTTINRFDYGLKWNGLTEAGGITVGEDVTIVLNVQFAQQKSTAN
ncbi:MAG TPA: YceI family protein [Chitinophagales bacterium]|nr:YceI family protein [Chitinophagales bacterium]